MRPSVKGERIDGLAVSLFERRSFLRPERGLAAALATGGPRCVVGASWTTDAPFRETAEAIEAARNRGILAVEMEAAALYAFARAADVRVLCLAHVTNTMGQAGDDFEKGEAYGARDSLRVLGAVVSALQRS